MIHILVVDDDVKLNKTVCTYLNDCGFEAKGVLDAQLAFEEMYNNLYDLIVSDIMMPQMDGFEFAAAVRKVNKHIPILFMSAKDDLPSKQKGFQLGIDDYMVKPVELAELEMRVQALLRRANIEMERKLTVGNLVLDADAVTAEVDGIEIPVATREFNILYKLLSYPKKHLLAHSSWTSSGGWKARPACAPWMSTSPSCGINFPAVMDLRSRPYAVLGIRRCCYESGKFPDRSSPEEYLPALTVFCVSWRSTFDVWHPYRSDRGYELARLA